MWYTTSYKRNLNILDSKIQKEFDITDIKQYNKDDEYDYDIFFEPLYTFKIKWEDYQEIITKTIYSNGNEAQYFVEYFPMNDLLHEVKINYEHIFQGYQCPKCREFHTLETTLYKKEFKKLDIECLECWYKRDYDSFVEDSENLDTLVLDMFEIVIFRWIWEDEYDYYNIYERLDWKVEEKSATIWYIPLKNRLEEDEYEKTRSWFEMNAKNKGVQYIRTID